MSMTGISESFGLERNLALYPWYQAAAGFLPWLPVFFLFFYQHVSLPEALQISAFYYLSVFLLEVPSGYFSDRNGRRPTLIIASCFAVVAYAVFIGAKSFGGFMLGQFLLAGFFSFKSGSDNSLLFDSLKNLGRESEYAHREAQGTRFSMLALALAALLGGITGMYNLVIPYVLSLLGAIVCMGLCFRFVEPVAAAQAAPFFRQLGICLSKLKERPLLWLFGYFVFFYALQHVPAEFNQPYVKLLEGEWLGGFFGNDPSALVSGCMVAVSMLGGALGAAVSMRLLDRLGVQTLLLSGLVIMTLIIGGMATVLHPVILFMVLFRNFPMAMTEAPMLSAIAPRIESSYRATYLSMQSLAGRLGFSACLLLLSAIVEPAGKENGMTWGSLQVALVISLVVAIFGTIALVLTKSSLESPAAGPKAPQ